MPLLCVEATDRLTFAPMPMCARDANIAADADLFVTGRARRQRGRLVDHCARGRADVSGHCGAARWQRFVTAGRLPTNSQQTQTRLWLRQDGDALEAMLLERLPDSRDEASDSAWEAVVAQAETAFALPFMPFPYSEWLPFVFTGHDVRACRAATVACLLVHGGACAQRASAGRPRRIAAADCRAGPGRSRCEFCGKRYEVSATQLADLFDHVDASHPPGSGTVH